MRRIRVAVCLVFVISCVLFGVYMVKTRMVEDHEPPVITSEKDTIKVSVKAKDSDLLKGLKAKDNKDGDITKSIRVSSMSHFFEKGKRTVTYAVFDKANQAATFERTLKYKDYEPPRIYLDKPLRYAAKDINSANFTANMIAEDCLDGNLTKQIHTTRDEDMYSADPGTYKLTAQVSNSAGDVCAVPMEVEVTDNDAAEKTYPMLKEYIAYTQVGEKINTKSYLTGVIIGGVEYSFKDDAASLGMTKDHVSIDSDVDYSEPGVYQVKYKYKNQAGKTAVTKLFVVVEE